MKVERIYKYKSTMGKAKNTLTVSCEEGKDDPLLRRDDPLLYTSLH